ncbi:ATP-binding protein [Nitrococcus mobilis]|uniref:histidine kinase n=1 Tax=Nitrococcus mobilis Nb-231 TaxID=314278 RepID=A4BPC7_9GAMM|nr:ATP-binding protein [Nitrococcus mobilis]EAR22428.1 sensor histidine kinase [Nitrococcus mobilis Nb-231]
MHEASTRINLRHLLMLRNFTIAGQTAAVLVAAFALNMAVPLADVGLVIAGLALLNAVAWRRLKRQQPGSHEFMVHLLADVLGLTALLYFTGGATNPFVWLLLLSLTIAATVLSRRQTWIIAAVTIACYSGLMVVYRPLPGAGGASGHFQMHVLGMWLGFMLSAALIAYFVAGMGQTLREQERALARARERALRDERLLSLATLAAGAAHELGTPLGTMAVLLKEMQAQVRSPNDQENVRILQAQIGRCRQALTTISASAGEVRAESGCAVALDRYLQDLLSQWQVLRPGVRLECSRCVLPSGLRIVADRTLTQALANLLHNAADASPDQISVAAAVEDDTLELTVSDRGAGLSPKIAAVLGRAPVTTKATGNGLGLYLTQGVIERLGGALTLSPRSGGGTVARVLLPLQRLRAAA